LTILGGLTASLKTELLTVSAKPSNAPASAPARAIDSEPSIAGTVLPIQRAEELWGTLPGVLNVRIISDASGEVSEVHVLTTTSVSPKQTVRNVESALLAQLGMRVSHKKISVATSEGPAADAIRAARMTPPIGTIAPPPIQPDEPPMARSTKRRLYFEDVEVRRSRASGISCRVTIRQGEDVYVGEASGMESDRLRLETASRAAVAAVQQADSEGRSLVFEGAKLIEAFEREFVFVALTTRFGRETALLTGSAEVKDGVETASVLAVLDATNRWMDL
jgi:hypothetical protein